MKKTLIISPLFAFLIFIPSFLFSSPFPTHPSIFGVVKDKTTQEKLPYVYITIPGTSTGTVTDLEGNYQLALQPGKYKIKVSYMLYKSEEFEVEIKGDQPIHIDVNLIPDAASLQTITVIASKVASSEEAVIHEIKETQNIASGVSSQQISKSQDNNASEVVRRIPGVTLMEGRFINVRGLSQRYNNVWINQGIAPSSETDSRAFSFDFIPSGMINNIIIYKNLSPDLPADFSGGFVKITTQDIPEKNQISIAYGTGFRTNSTFGRQQFYATSSSDLIGAGTISRNLSSNFPENLNTIGLEEACEAATTLNPNWVIRSRTAIPDQNLSFFLTDKKKVKQYTIGQIAYVSYSYFNDQVTMKNDHYGIYNQLDHESSYNKQYVDTQYITNVKTAAAYTISLVDYNGNKISFKNLFQNIGNDLLMLRGGHNYSNGYIEKSQSFLYRNRLTYASQIVGNHNLKRDTNSLNWTIGYCYARNNEPDRRIMDARMDQNESSPYYGQYKSMDNDIRRYFQKLNEHAVSGSLDYEHKLFFHRFTPSFKTGIYSEYKHRDFNARNFTYKKGLHYQLPENYFYLPYEDMMDEQYLHPDGFFLVENTGKADSYQSSNTINAAYFLVNLPFFGFTLNGGLRFEYQHLELDSYESDGIRPVNIRQNNFDLFPAVNLSYAIKEKHIFRIVYGKTINRPEFREIAPYVYYDFESFSYYEGNTYLENAKIHNVDFRYEFYPQTSEMISIGAFYKQFVNPIEMTYFYAGGQMQYTYMNAHSAYSVGIEIDIRKSLDFMKLKNFSIVLNTSFLKSEVVFPENSVELNRPMQGQSPYIVNAGLYYDNSSLGLTFSILYNIAGKRIVAVGQANQNANENIPNTYEMPRHSLDLSIQKQFGRCTVKLGAKNILCQKIILSQLGSIASEHEVRQYSQETKVVNSGLQINVGVSVKINK